MTVPKTGKKRSGWSPQASHFRQWLWPAYRRYLLRSDAPILVGPFWGEIGFEALYWQPWVQALMRDGVKPERIIPISRAGAACWYGVPQGLELYAMRTPQQIRLEAIKVSRRTGSNKPMTVTAFDKAIYADAAATLGLKTYLTLHPAWMYQSLWPFWAGQRGLDWLYPKLAVSILPPPPLPDGLPLPPQFVTAKFYWRPTFPPGPSTKSFVEGCLRHVASTVPIVVLDTPYYVDDHCDCEVPAIPGVQLLSQIYPHLTVETALAVQSAVLARGIGFVGTYGGFSHLALRFARPNLSVYAQWVGAALPHKFLCESIGLATNTPTQVLGLGDLAMLQAALPKVVIEQPGGKEFDTAELVSA